MVVRIDYSQFSVLFFNFISENPNAPFRSSCILKNILNDEKRCGVSCDDEAAFLSLQLIIGAADTVRYFSLQAKIVSNQISEKSRISTWTFLEAMMLYPEVQVKAQKEIGTLLPFPHEKSLANKSPVSQISLLAIGSLPGTT
jgi:hypothetical protein